MRHHAGAMLILYSLTENGSMFDQRLVRKINLGRCFALLGAGASAELGYPSWPTLAKEIVDGIRQAGKLSDEESYSTYLMKRQLPELFTLAERDLGGRQALIDMIKSLVCPEIGKTHKVYDLLIGWPFACYMTTNWDDQIDRFLKGDRVFYQTLQNTKSDFSAIRHDASNFIVKLHSDLEHPDLAVITSADYQRLQSSEWAYFRDRLKAIFEMFDVMIVGHSMSDPDLKLILQMAKESASPEHPVFMIAANLTKAEEQELLDRFNIVTLPYKDTDGTHSQLRRVLALLDKFIIRRRQRFDTPDTTITPAEVEAVQALAVYRRLAVASDSDIQPRDYLGPLILQTLRDVREGVTMADLKSRNPLASAISSEATQEPLSGVLDYLTTEGLILNDAGLFHLTDRGRTDAEEMAQQRVVEESQAYGQFSTELAAKHKSVTEDEQRSLVDLLRSALVRVFKHRGLSIANAVFTGQSPDRDVLGDVFSVISSTASGVTNRDLALAYMEAAQLFILEPTAFQKKYLASLSQGFFLYHLFGLDPTCAKVRREVFQQTIWWCDSSTLIPLVAMGCGNHDYVQHLFSRLQALKAFTLTTSRLLREVVEHLEWFVKLLRRDGIASTEVLAAASQLGSYKQNLFLDGFIRASAEGRVGDFAEYLRIVAPHGITEPGIRKLLEQYGVRVVNMDEMRGYTNDDTREMFELTYEISEARTRSATLRSSRQIEAEAEILMMIRKLQEGVYSAPIENAAFERSYFLSQSRVLDRIPPVGATSWTPEALYRYIAALPGENLDPDLLQRCMLEEYFASGAVLIDMPRYQKFFGPSINAANTTYQAERDAYLREFPIINSGDFDESFKATPDLQKPLFVEQMGWKLARQQQHVAEEKDRQLVIAKERTAAAISEMQRIKLEMDAKGKKRKAARDIQLKAEERNAQDPKHIRKRIRQAKKRKKS
jgi:hypothetical protein